MNKQFRYGAFILVPVEELKKLQGPFVRCALFILDPGATASDQRENSLLNVIFKDQAIS
jgi:hypothetical protein